MIELTQSLAHWLWMRDPSLSALIMFGHTELLTEEMWDEYIEWCKTDDGKQYLKGGSKYREDWDESSFFEEMGKDFISIIKRQQEQLKTAKADAIKEFAERLRSYYKQFDFFDTIHFWEVINHIDLLAEEMVGENNDSN